MSGGGRTAQQSAQRLLEKLQKGEDSVEDADEFIAHGSAIPDALILASLGNRTTGSQTCSNVLKKLLDANGNPNATDQMTQGPVLHSAAWHGSNEAVKILLDYRADIEAQERQMKTPPLNTALAAGNAKVCLELLNRNADVLWTHQDGATALHVATAWISSSHNAQLRMPPMGEEPKAVISMMLHNGVDPTQCEGQTRSATRGKGMTPLESFRRQIASSPWRSDPAVGAKFDKNAKVIHVLLEQGEQGVKLKNQGNTAFGEKRYEDALKLYAEARSVWEAAGIRGHHNAVLWSNEATCHRKLEAWSQAKEAAEQGLTHYCSAKIRKKLEDLVADSDKEMAAVAAGVVKEKPAPVPRKPPSKLDDGFIEKAATADKPLYGEEGSAQGKVDKPGPFICGFEDAKEAGFVDGVDGWKDRMTRDEQALDRNLVKQGLMSADLIDDPKDVRYINPLPPGVG